MIYSPLTKKAMGIAYAAGSDIPAHRLAQWQEKYRKARAILTAEE